MFTVLFRTVAQARLVLADRLSRVFSLSGAGGVLGCFFPGQSLQPVRIPVAARSRAAVRALVIVLALLAVGVPGRVFAQPITTDEKQSILKRTESILRSRAYASTADFAKWPDMVEKYKDRLDRADTVSSFSSVLNRLMNEFGISHLDVMTPKMAEQRSKTSQVGIGIKHSGRGEPFPEGLSIDQIIGGGPAERAGIKDGDTILKVDGTALTTTEQLRGEEGSVIVLTIRRAAAENQEAKLEDVTIARGKFRTRDPESFAKIADDTSFIRIPSFDNTYDRRRVESLFKQAADSKYLVIDLRNNGGGATTNLGHFLGMVLPRGTEYGTSVDRDTSEKYREETGKDPSDVLAVAAWSRDKWKVRRNPIEPFTGKVVVLINRASASASEIAAAALKELHNPPATLIGGRTAGAVLVANDVSLPDGFRMMVPISEYVTIKGRRLEGNPLKPDIGGPFSLERVGNKPETDEVVKLALRELRKD